MSVTCQSCRRYDKCSECGSTDTKFYGRDICAGNVHMLCEDFDPIDSKSFRRVWEHIPADSCSEAVSDHPTKLCYYVVWSGQTADGLVKNGCSSTVRDTEISSIADVKSLGKCIQEANDLSVIIIQNWIKLDTVTSDEAASLI